MADRYASLKQGLVGCWIPSVSGSGLLLPDLSGRNNNGSLVGMDASDWVSSGSGRALDFDGVDDVVSCPQVPFTGTGNFSISLWVLQATIRASDHAIKFGTATLNNAVGIFNSSGNNLAIGLHANSASEASLTANLSTNVFYHVVGTCTPNRREIWLNGVLQGTSTATVNYDITSTFCNIGAAQSTLVPWNGRLDDVRVYSRVLTEPEIKLLASDRGIGFKRNTSAFATRYAYKPAKPRNYSVIRNRDPNYSTLRQGLVAAYCPSISGQGNVLPDLVGGNHGTLTNMDASDWVSSGDGRALDFDGSNDYVNLGANHNLTGAFSFSIWANLRSKTGYKLILAKSDFGSSPNKREFLFYVSGTDLTPTDSLAFLIMNPTSFTNRIGRSLPNASIPLNQFTNFICTYTGNGANSGIAIYINGVRSDTTDQGLGTFTGVVTQATPLAIGTDFNNFPTLGNQADMISDDIRIYNRALTESEIKLLASRPGIGLRQESHRQTFYQFPSGSRRRRILTGMP